MKRSLVLCSIMIAALLLVPATFAAALSREFDASFGPDFGAATVSTVVRRGYLEQCPNVGIDLMFDGGEHRLTHALEQLP